MFDLHSPKTLVHFFVNTQVSNLHVNEARTSTRPAKIAFDVHTGAYESTYGYQRTRFNVRDRRKKVFASVRER